MNRAWVGEREVTRVMQQCVDGLAQDRPGCRALVTLTGGEAADRVAALNELARLAEEADVYCARVGAEGGAAASFERLPARIAAALEAAGVFSQLPLRDTDPTTQAPWPIVDFKVVIKLAKRAAQRNSPVVGWIATLLEPGDRPANPPAGLSAADSAILASAMDLASQYDPFELLAALLQAASRAGDGLVVTCDDLDSMFPTGEDEAARAAGEQLIALHDQLVRARARVSMWFGHAPIDSNSAVRGQWFAERRAQRLTLQGPQPADVLALFEAWREHRHFAGRLAEGGPEILEEIAASSRSWSALERTLDDARLDTPDGPHAALRLKTSGMLGRQYAVLHRIRGFAEPDPFEGVARPADGEWFDACRALFRLGAPRAAARLLYWRLARNELPLGLTLDRVRQRFGGEADECVLQLLGLDEHAPMTETTGRHAAIERLLAQIIHGGTPR